MSEQDIFEEKVESFLKDSGFDDYLWVVSMMCGDCIKKQLLKMYPNFDKEEE